MALISFLSSWLRPSESSPAYLSRSRVSQAKRRVCSRPGVEALEDRLPPGDLSGTLGMSPLTDLSDHLALGPTSEEFSSGESVEVAPEWMDLLTVTESAWDLDYTFDDPVEEPAAVLDESETPVEEAPTAEPSLEEVVNTLTDDFLDDPLGTPETTNEETPVTSESPTGPGSTSIPTTGDASSPGGPQPGTMEDGGPTGPTAPTNAPGEDEQTMAQMTTDGQDPGVSPRRTMPAIRSSHPRSTPARRRTSRSRWRPRSLPMSPTRRRRFASRDLPISRGSCRSRSPTWMWTSTTMAALTRREKRALAMPGRETSSIPPARSHS